MDLHYLMEFLARQDSKVKIDILIILMTNRKMLREEIESLDYSRSSLLFSLLLCIYSIITVLYAVASKTNSFIDFIYSDVGFHWVFMTILFILCSLFIYVSQEAFSRMEGQSSNERSNEDQIHQKEE